MQPLYGREEVLGRAREALGRAARGAGRRLLFTGEPGIGQSRLAEQVASDAQIQGWAVAWGRCWEAGGAPAYLEALEKTSTPAHRNVSYGSLNGCRMPRLAVGASVLALCAFGCAAGVPPAKPAVPSADSAARPAPARLEFGEFFEPGARLQPSEKLRSLAGKRVRLVGFMAQLELPPRGAFYLVPRPIHCDESGGGTADLPPESVLVLSTASTGQVVPFLDGALELTGTFELGNAPDSEGRVAAFRLRLDAS